VRCGATSHIGLAVGTQQEPTSTEQAPSPIAKCRTRIGAGYLNVQRTDRELEPTADPRFALWPGCAYVTLNALRSLGTSWAYQTFRTVGTGRASRSLFTGGSLRASWTLLTDARGRAVRILNGYVLRIRVAPRT
jgi:hypothetical protein